MPLYTQAYIYVDGRLLGENVNVSTRLDRRTEDVFSVEKNFEGQDVGPFVRVVEANNVFPAAGLEVDFERLMWEGRKAEIMISDGGSEGDNKGEEGGGTLVTNGTFTRVGRSAGVGQNYTVSFTFRGDASIFE